MNDILARWQIPIFIVNFESLWEIKFTKELSYYEFLFTLMWEKGIHTWDGIPCFPTEAHTEQDIDTLTYQFTESFRNLMAAGFFHKPDASDSLVIEEMATYPGKIPPAYGARLGREKDGNPAWFLPNPELPGKYLQVEKI